MKILCASVGALALSASAALAVPLTGSGAHLPIVSPIVPANQGRTTAPIAGGFSGTWTAPAAAAWVGTFTALGPIPAGLANPIGTTRYDFTSLPLGALSAGTYFRFGDLDGGSSTTETFTLRAFDASNSLITAPWLDGPVYTGGIGTGPGSSLVTGNMPGWSWTAGTGSYFFDGSTITTANPSVSFYLESNMDIAYLQLTRTSAFANFSLGAPLVPAPGSAALLAAAGIAGARRRRR